VLALIAMTLTEGVVSVVKIYGPIVLIVLLFLAARRRPQ